MSRKWIRTGDQLDAISFYEAVAVVDAFIDNPTYPPTDEQLDAILAIQDSGWYGVVDTMDQCVPVLVEAIRRFTHDE